MHAFHRDGGDPVVDDTFSRVTIDGISLDPEMVRILMAQSSLPHIERRVVAMNCTGCGKPKFSRGEHAFNPASLHHCDACGLDFTSVGRMRKLIGNPLVGVLDGLATKAARRRQRHTLGLMPETL